MRAKSPRIERILLLLPFVALAAPSSANAQGCSTAAGTPNFQVGERTALLSPGQVFVQYRWNYSESDKIYNFDDRVRPAEAPTGPSVVNIQSEHLVSLDVGVLERLIFSVEMPFEYNNRSLNATAVSGGRVDGRMQQVSAGLADMRFLLRYWLLPEGTIPGNISIEAGVKAPTGEEAGTDAFMGETFAYDSSIQRGTGSWDPIIGAGMFLHFGPVVPFANVRYQMTPKESTGVQALHPQLGNPNTSVVNSIPDQINWRIGAALDVGTLVTDALEMHDATILKHIRPWVAFVGSHVLEDDLIGGSAGFRRAFDAYFIEPGIEWGLTERFSINVSAPITLYRRLTTAPGTFPDIQLNVGIGITIN